MSSYQWRSREVNRRIHRGDDEFNSSGEFLDIEMVIFVEELQQVKASPSYMRNCHKLMYSEHGLDALIRRNSGWYARH